MKIIFVISPDYLENVYKEAKGYDFFIQGYGSFEEASRGLIKTNVTDILGFVYVAQALPDDLNPVVDFMMKCNILNANKKFIFALQDTSNLANIINAVKFNNLRLFYLPEIEVVTDTVINKDIFGSILLDNFKPYKLKEEEVPKLADFSFNKLSYTPLFPESFLDCLKPIDKLDTVEQTKLFDSVYQEYEKFNKKLARIRLGFIEREFNINQDEKELLKIIEDETTNYCLYRSLIKILITGDDYEQLD